MEEIELPIWYVDKAGSRIWYLPSKGKQYKHRLSGPAIEHINGTKEYWVDGKRHRLNGPAIIYKDGAEEWWVDGKRHRLDGPAIENSWNSSEWYIDGILLSKTDVENWIKENNMDLTNPEHQLAFKLAFSGGKSGY